MTEGPLGVGVGSFKHDPLRASLSLKEHGNPVAGASAGDARASASGNPFGEVRRGRGCWGGCTCNVVHATPPSADGAAHHSLAPLLPTSCLPPGLLLQRGQERDLQPEQLSGGHAGPRGRRRRWAQCNCCMGWWAGVASTSSVCMGMPATQRRRQPLARGLLDVAGSQGGTRGRASPGDITPRSKPSHAPALPPGLIGTTVYGGPASDPASPRIVKQASGTAAAAAVAAATAPQAASNPNSTNAPFAWPAMDASTAGTACVPAAPGAQAPQHSRSATVVAARGRPGGAAPAPAAAGRPAPTSSDYLAALDSAATNPFETPALRQQEQQQDQVAAAKAAAKQELLRQVRRQGDLLLCLQVGVGLNIDHVPHICCMLQQGSAALPACLLPLMPCPPPSSAPPLQLTNRCRARSTARRSWTRSGVPCWLSWTRACRWVGGGGRRAGAGGGGG